MSGFLHSPRLILIYGEARKARLGETHMPVAPCRILLDLFPFLQKLDITIESSRPENFPRLHSPFTIDHPASPPVSEYWWALLQQP
jgi:hypothetical protein